MNGGADSPTSPARDRIEALDVLRGIAVAGILYANVLGFFGLVFLPPDRAAAFPTDRCRDHRDPDPAQRLVALALPLRAGRVDLAPAHLR
jgi:hypothetical protein